MQQLVLNKTLAGRPFEQELRRRSVHPPTDVQREGRRRSHNLRRRN
jgi:hypothetical protein